MYGKKIPNKSERKWVFSNIFDSVWRDRSDIYLTVRENIQIQAQRNPAYADLIKLWDVEFFTMKPGLIEENWDIVQKLQTQGNKVFAVANFASDKHPEAVNRFPKLNSLDDVLISSEAKFRIMGLRWDYGDSLLNALN